jgi:molybdopterin-guanine dinucleotide biosynthesis protein
MALYFISAVSGTGKTTLMHELHRRGEEAHDTDVECIRCSKQTGEPISYEEAKRDGYNWIYPTEHLQLLKTQSRAKNIFLLGSVDNFDEVKASADEYIWMTIPLDALLHRLDTREKEYGKSDSERQPILALYQRMQSATSPTTFMLDATKPVAKIADDLLAHVGRTSK